MPRGAALGLAALGVGLPADGAEKAALCARVPVGLFALALTLQVHPSAEKGREKIKNIYIHMTHTYTRPHKHQSVWQVPISSFPNQHAQAPVR